MVGRTGRAACEGEGGLLSTGCAITTVFGLEGLGTHNPEGGVPFANHSQSLSHDFHTEAIKYQSFRTQRRHIPRIQPKINGREDYHD